MSNNEHPITPPPELVKQWRSQWMAADGGTDSYQNIATQAARWGADMELKACEEWIAIRLNCTDQEYLVPYLRAARRPPSLAQRALHILGKHGDLSPAEHDAIRRALEQLPD